MDKEHILAQYRAAKQIAQEIDAEFREAAFSVIFSRLLQPTEVQTVTPIRAQPGLSTGKQLPEFLALINAHTHPEKVTAIAYYFLHENQSDRFTQQEILDAYGRARLPKPKNLSDVISQCIRRGYLVDASEPKDGRKAWQITPTGEKYVQEMQKG